MSNDLVWAHRRAKQERHTARLALDTARSAVDTAAAANTPLDDMVTWAEGVSDALQVLTAAKDTYREKDRVYVDAKSARQADQANRELINRQEKDMTEKQEPTAADIMLGPDLLKAMAATMTADADATRRAHAAARVAETAAYRSGGNPMEAWLDAYRKSRADTCAAMEQVLVGADKAYHHARVVGGSTFTLEVQEAADMVKAAEVAAWGARQTAREAEPTPIPVAARVADALERVLTALDDALVTIPTGIAAEIRDYTTGMHQGNLNGERAIVSHASLDEWADRMERLEAREAVIRALVGKWRARAIVLDDEYNRIGDQFDLGRINELDDCLIELLALLTEPTTERK